MGQAHTRIVVGLAVIGLVAGCRTSTQIKDVARTEKRWKKFVISIDPEK